MNFFISCPKNIAPLLFEELNQLGCTQLKQSEAGVFMVGELADAYKICLWSRLANRVLLTLKTCSAMSAESLYEGVQQIHWGDHFTASNTFVVDVTGVNEALSNTQFTAQKIKDAVVDQFRLREGNRPSINKENPDLRIHARIQRDAAIISLDLSGQSLHQRGYRLQGGAAPLKENLAAAILLRCGWPVLAKTDAAFVDPMCGSGTFLFEALLMSAQIAPGLLRNAFGFSHWQGHQPSTWQSLLTVAAAEREKNLKGYLPPFIGFDHSLHTLELAKENAKRLGLEKHCTFKQCAVKDIKNNSGCENGLILSNPPYGERMGNDQDLPLIYQSLAEKMRSEFYGWQAGIFTGNAELCARIGMKPRKKYSFLNGSLPCQLFLYTLENSQFL